jgi:hypothetical protein
MQLGSAHSNDQLIAPFLFQLCIPTIYKIVHVGVFQRLQSSIKLTNSCNLRFGLFVSKTERGLCGGKSMST